VKEGRGGREGKKEGTRRKEGGLQHFVFAVAQVEGRKMNEDEGRKEDEGR
jgi:hypothetical protein